MIQLVFPPHRLNPDPVSTIISVKGQAGVQAPLGGILVKYHMNSMTPGNWMKMILTLNMNASAAAVKEATGEAGNLRTEKNEWHVTFGDDSYVRKAFESARKYTEKYGETQMKLYYKDYATSIPANADGIVRLCKPLFEAGFLDGIGMQEHDRIGVPAAEAWIASYDKFYPICSEMAVTELDVNTTSIRSHLPRAIMTISPEAPSPKGLISKSPYTCSTANPARSRRCSAS